LSLQRFSFFLWAELGGINGIWKDAEGIKNNKPSLKKHGSQKKKYRRLQNHGAEALSNTGLWL